VSRAQLAILPVVEGRSAERRIVNLAARLRDPGARIIDVEVLNLSTDGFMAEAEVALDVGTNVWLKLPGLEPQNSRVIWAEEGKAGFQFSAPLHQATVDMLIETDRKPIVKGHFGPQAGARR
jgi:hypothetical protein